MVGKEKREETEMIRKVRKTTKERRANLDFALVSVAMNQRL